MKRVTINTKGMHCTSCESLIEMALEDIKGVKHVEPSHKTGTVVVEFEESVADLNEIKKAIENEGFKV